MAHNANPNSVGYGKEVAKTESQFMCISSKRRLMKKNYKTPLKMHDSVSKKKQYWNSHYSSAARAREQQLEPKQEYNVMLD